MSERWQRRGRVKWKQMQARIAPRRHRNPFHVLQSGPRSWAQWYRVGVFNGHLGTKARQADTIERLEAALKPFARIADMQHKAKDGESVMVNVSRCRDARQALEGTTDD